jgi:iron complex transport system substrate-binding protein
LVFGKLFDKEKIAIHKFKEIEKNYNSLKIMVEKSINKPLVVANEMYGNSWFIPGGKTSLAHFISDAGAKFINEKNIDSVAVPMSFEQVFKASSDAVFWVNAGNHKTKKELLQINSNYAKMNVFNNGKIYVVTGKEKGKSNDFFESGIVRGDLVLKDYVKIFHPELLPNYHLIYMKELK